MSLYANNSNTKLITFEKKVRNTIYLKHYNVFRSNNYHGIFFSQKKDANVIILIIFLVIDFISKIDANAVTDKESIYYECLLFLAGMHMILNMKTQLFFYFRREHQHANRNKFHPDVLSNTIYKWFW